jgi:2',3'-cyclic-nucleotide 2'-phosphodiesterase
MRLVFIGDVVGGTGRRTLAALLPGLRERHEPDFVVVNGENAAGGVGITERTATELFDAGADAITLGNHAYRHAEVYPYLDREPRILRPANLAAAAPGHGLTVAPAADGTAVAVINLLGRLYLDAAVSPFDVAESLAAEARERAPVVLVDFHAEATSEKVALGRHLDGKVTAVLGTHTHVQTNDAAVLRGGTAYITDAGMTGPHDSVIGVRADLILRRFLTQLPVRFEPAEGGVRIEGALVECDGDGRATRVEAFRLNA